MQGLRLFAHESASDPGKLLVSDVVPEPDSGKVMYFLKLEEVALTVENAQVSCCGNLSSFAHVLGSLLTSKGLFLSPPPPRSSSWGCEGCALQHWAYGHRAGMHLAQGAPEPFMHSRVPQVSHKEVRLGLQSRHTLRVH